MRRIPVRALLLVGVCLIASPGSAGARQEEPGVVEPRSSESTMTTTITGTLVSRSGGSFVVEKDTGARLSFALGDGAVIPEDVEPGDRVTVTFDTLDGREYHAVGVRAGAEAVPAAAPREGVTAGANGARPGESEPMPETGSPLPVLVLIGLIATGAAAGLRLFRRRVV